MLHAFDLHVLGMPPAFVLSQDQTLNLAPVPLAKSRTKPGTDRFYILSGIDRSHSIQIRETNDTVRRRRPRIPSTLTYNVKEHSPQPEGAALISLAPIEVNSDSTPLGRAKQPLRPAPSIASFREAAAVAADSADKKPVPPFPGPASRFR